MDVDEVNWYDGRTTSDSSRSRGLEAVVNGSSSKARHVTWLTLGPLRVDA